MQESFLATAFVICAQFAIAIVVVVFIVRIVLRVVRALETFAKAQTETAEALRALVDSKKQNE